MALDQLQLSSNPFASRISRAHIAPPLRRTLDDVWRQIRRKTKAIVVVGSAGTGKSLLLDLLEAVAKSRSSEAPMRCKLRQSPGSHSPMPESSARMMLIKACCVSSP